MEKTYGMKWHKFLINFSLWMNAAASLLFSFGCFKIAVKPFGRYLAQQSDMVPVMDVLGVVFLALAVCEIIVRFRLARYKAGAYKFLLGVQLVSSIACGVFMAIDMDASLFGCVTGMVIPLLTYYYYTKRAELFVN